MTKVYSNLFVLILIAIFTITKQDCEGSATKADDCKDDSLSQDEKDKLDLVHCCYLKYEKSSRGGLCTPVTSKMYNNFGKVLKKVEENYYYSHKISIDCKSSYLHLFLFVLIMQLILL